MNNQDWEPVIFNKTNKEVKKKQDNFKFLYYR